MTESKKYCKNSTKKPFFSVFFNFFTTNSIQNTQKICKKFVCSVFFANFATNPFSNFNNHPNKNNLTLISYEASKRHSIPDSIIAIAIPHKVYGNVRG
jgi:hypothetical protein